MAFIPKYVAFDPRKYVSQADISLAFGDGSKDDRVSLPVGNGRFATPVTTEDSVVYLGTGHTDLFPFSAASTAKGEDINANYACGMADIYIDFHDSIFCGETEQYVNYYEGVCGFRAKNIEIEFTADMATDLIAVRIKDDRRVSPPVTVTLKTLRPGVAESSAHSAVSAVKVKNGNVMLTQEFSEDCDYGDEKRLYSANSAVALRLQVDGEETSAGADAWDGGSISCSAQRNTNSDGSYGYLTLYISGAVSYVDLKTAENTASDVIKNGLQKGVRSISADRAEWFADFWSKSFIQADGRKCFLRASTVMWIRNLYLFALSKRGKYPPLHQANPLYNATQIHDWGSRFWWFNQSRYEYGMLNINHPELNRPLMDMVWRNLPAYGDFARQAFGTKGICITETSAHDGFQRVPSVIESEMKRLFLYAQRPSQDYIDYGRQRDHYLSMWNSLENGDMSGSYTMRMVYPAADIADLFRLHYLYSGDESFLRDRAYPMMREAAEFYRNSPLLHKEKDGKYHTFPTNYAETFWGARDVIDDISMISSLFPIVIYYALKLNVDAELVPLWQEVADNITGIPVSDEADAISPRSKDGKRGFAMCRKPCLVPFSRGEEYPGTACDEQIRPIMNYDYVTLDSHNAQLRELCMNTLDAHLVLRQMEDEANGGAPVEMDDCLRFTTDCARLGRTDLAQQHILYQFGRVNGGYFDASVGDYPQAMTDIRGKAITDLQMWAYYEGISECLLGCCSDGISYNESIIHIAPAWNMAWNVSFMLAARGGFEVACEICDGKTRSVEVFSKLGGVCRIHNSFGKAVRLEDETGKTCELSGDCLVFNTEKNKQYALFVTID